MPVPAPTPSPAHAPGQPSGWIQRWAHLVPAAAPVLDVACGAGRHLRLFAERGHPVCGVDRDLRAAQALADAMRAAAPERAAFELVQADIEAGPWPLQSGGETRRFAAVVVTNYLWRPLLPTLLDSVDAGGLLLYETFAAGQETVGRPARPEFLLQAGELLQVCAGWHVLAFEQGFLSDPDRFVQRIAAVRPALQSLTPSRAQRYSLSG